MTRYLEEDLRQEVKLTTDQMHRETDREREHYFRKRWLFCLLYLCGLFDIRSGRQPDGDLKT